MNKLILFCLLSFSAYSHDPIECDDKNYHGKCKNGLASGHGVFKDPNDDVYDGLWKHGKPNGHGFCKFLNGDTYDGNWKDGEKSGNGFYKALSGSEYTGEWKDNKRNGYGVLNLVNIVKYEGNWKNDEKNGLGVEIFQDGTWVTGNWLHEHFIPTLANLGDLRFSALLLESFPNGGYFAYPLGIMAKYLKEYAKTHSDDFKAASVELTSAQYFLIHHSLLESTIIYEALHQNKSILIPYGYLDHAMGLKIGSFNHDFFSLLLFNSGDGLNKFHVKNLSHEYQTLLVVQVPKSELTLELVQKLLNYSNFKSAQEAYGAILNIPGAQKIMAPDLHGIWMHPQKSNNCTLEWIFAYLKNTTSESTYKEMREQLYKDTYKALKAAPWPDFIDPDTHKITLNGHVYTAKAAKEFLLKELEKKILEYPTCKISASRCD